MLLSTWYAVSDARGHDAAVRRNRLLSHNTAVSASDYCCVPDSSTAGGRAGQGRASCRRFDQSAGTAVQLCVPRTFENVFCVSIVQSLLYHTKSVRTTQECVTRQPPTHPPTHAPTHPPASSCFLCVCSLVAALSRHHVPCVWFLVAALLLHHVYFSYVFWWLIFDRD